MLEVMVDLETFGTNNDAAIVALGAVKFDPMDADVPMEKFYCSINPTSAIALGGKVDGDTLLWWLHPDRAAARDQLFSEPKEMLDIASALEGFRIWFGPESVPVWGNGATFDNVLLRTAFGRIGRDCPWMFWHDRCYRTMKGLYPEIKMVRSGTHHNALDDAISQAEHLQALMKHATEWVHV